MVPCDLCARDSLVARLLVALQLYPCPFLRLWRATANCIPNTIRCRWKCDSHLYGSFLHWRSTTLTPSEEAILNELRDVLIGCLYAMLNGRLSCFCAISSGERP